jgi:hypothetical protein
MALRKAAEMVICSVELKHCSVIFFLSYISQSQGRRKDWPLRRELTGQGDSQPRYFPVSMNRMNKESKSTHKAVIKLATSLMEAEPNATVTLSAC